MTLLREPLLHFAVIGAVLFGSYSWLGDKGAETEAVEPVRIGEGDIRWLKQTWSGQWLRDPTPDELKGLLNDLVSEELMAREALEMALDKDDTIVRRRLAQKLKFLVEDTAQLAEPTESELRQFYTSHAAGFEIPGKVSFRQIYFSAYGRKDAVADAKAMLAGLRPNSESSSDLGDRFLLGDDFQHVDKASLSSMFGADFASTVFSLKPGDWSGPIESGYGQHLVLVAEHIPGESKPFDTVKEAVLAQWRSEKQQELSRAYLAGLRKKYGVELDDGAKAALDAKSAPNVAAR
jgi:parvulin-like peptidyl-prolyl isomerase